MTKRHAEIEQMPPTESGTDERFSFVHFVVQNLPEIPFLRKMARDGRQLSFPIGDQKWKLEVANDTMDSAPARVITLSLENPPSPQEALAAAIITDFNFKNIIGLSYQSGTNSFIMRTFPTDLAGIIKEARAIERSRVIEAYRTTPSVAQISQLNGLRPRLVRADIDYAKRRGLI